MKEVVIAAATRTAIGSFNGAFSPCTVVDLGAAAIKEVCARAKIGPEVPEEVIMGNVLQSGLGQNTARQAAMHAGLPKETPSFAINKVCGSGLKSVCLAAQAIQSGDAECVIAGGMESMTNAAYVLDKARQGLRMGNATLVDSMVNDGLIDAFNNYHMGITAENVAEKYGITREMQDAFALSSQQKAIAAIDAGAFKDEIFPFTVKGRKGDIIIDTDEYPRRDASMESMAKLRPAFKKDGTVTAGNASGINDGAAAMVVMSAELAAKKGITPLARIVAYASAGVDPAYMGIGPIFSSQKALKKAGWNVQDLDFIEANEAFAAQCLAVGNELGFDPKKLNVNGGAIALGHPIGASGARVLVTLLHILKNRGGKRGLATLCIGGGQGISMLVERV